MGIEMFKKIQIEILQSIDKDNKELAVANIELFLKYRVRFYVRQFITREKENLIKFEWFKASLSCYIQSGKAKELGTPSVSFLQKNNICSLIILET